MALSYVPVDRDQLFLLPPSVRDWLPEGHLVWFVLEVVERVDTSALHDRHPNDGVGRRAYDPDMLLALLIYAYCTGQRSSRQIERLCEVDVGYRVICANQVPDHTTIARFRQDHEQIAAQMFVDVLVLCAAAGLAKVGVVAVDGTKMAADASRKANRTRQQLEAEVGRMLAEAAELDGAQDRLFGDGRGDELPVELVDPRRRAARLDAALAELEAQQQARRASQERAETDRAARRAAKEQAAAAKGQLPRGARPKTSDPLADAQAHLDACAAIEAAERADWQARRDRALAAGQRPPSPPLAYRSWRARRRLERLMGQLTAPDRTGEASPHDEEVKVNITDPDSRLMKDHNGWVQGYNAQAAVNERGVIVAAPVTQDAFDTYQCQPMMAATLANLDAAGIDQPVGTMLFDAGYCSTANLTAAGPERLIATTKSWKLRQAARQHGWAQGDPPADANAIQAMEHRLRTEEGAALYTKRQHTVEPVFGDIKHGRGFRRFARRGLSAADAEWKLIAATHNVLKLFRAGPLLA